ncbi:ARID DNA-binding domain [Dillenia turbinata]|uniref:ARID DNA-binding domain n=1 Tax=Dillenia turbinata TaxID=194707 RepID=A0AAN8YZ02_9MAGN
MAGWSILDDGSDSDYVETLHKNQKFGLGLTIDSSLGTSSESGNSEKLRCSFDRFLSAFLKQVSSSTCFRPLPPMLGNGKSVDLFKLFLVVKQKGGYGAVCRNGLWELVAEETGLDSGVESALKLVYVKYLDSLDQWLKRVFGDNGGVEHSFGDSWRGFGGISMDLEREFRDFLSDNLVQKKRDEKCLQVDLEKDGFRHLSALDMDCLDEVNGEVSDDKSEVKDGAGGEPELDNCGYGYDEDNAHQHNEGELKTEAGSELASDRRDTFGNDDGDCASRKRKHESNTTLLGWLYEVARDPCDPAIGLMPETSKWKSYGDEELWKQVLLVRQTLFLKDIKSSAEQCIWQVYFRYSILPFSLWF